MFSVVILLRFQLCSVCWIVQSSTTEASLISYRASIHNETRPAISPPLLHSIPPAAIPRSALPLPWVVTFLLYFSICLISLGNSSAHLEMNLSLSVCNLMKPKATFISLHLSHLGLGLALSLYFRRSPYPQTLLSVLLSHSASDEDNLWEGAKRCAYVKRKEDTGRGEWRPSQLADLWLRDQRGVWTKDKKIENSGVMHFFSFSFLNGHQRKSWLTQCLRQENT